MRNQNNSELAHHAPMVVILAVTVVFGRGVEPLPAATIVVRVWQCDALVKDAQSGQVFKLQSGQWPKMLKLEANSSG
jgi:hypothetical protein